MPVIFLALGVVILIIGMRGQAANASALLAQEFTGPGSFVMWFLAIAILGALSAYKPARAAANAMLTLVIVAMILANGKGFFANLQSAFTTAKATPVQHPGAGTPASGSGASTSGAGSGAGGIVGNLNDWACSLGLPSWMTNCPPKAGEQASPSPFTLPTIPNIAPQLETPGASFPLGGV